MWIVLSVLLVIFTACTNGAVNEPTKKVSLSEIDKPKVSSEMVEVDGETEQNTQTKVKPEKESEPKPKVDKDDNKSKSQPKQEPNPKQEVKAETGTKPKDKPKQDPEKGVKFTTEKMSGEFMSEVDLNMRTGPSTEYKAVGYLKPYEKAIATKKSTYKGSTWYKITYKGVTGWASSNYLKKYKKDAKPKTNTSANASSSSNSKNTSSNSSRKYKPNHIYFSGKAVPYKNIGRADTNDGTKGKAQQVINGGVYSATWGGASTFSGTDGMNTHFIGHNPGVFSGMHTSSEFIVTDGSGNAYTYRKSAYYVVDEYGVRTDNGQDVWDRIVGTGGGERITLQSTKNHPLKHIVEATLVK